MGYTDKLHHCVTGTGSDTVPNTGPTPSESATTLDQTLAQYSQIFLLVTTNPNSSIRLPDRKARFVTPEKMPSLQRTGLFHCLHWSPVVQHALHDCMQVLHCVWWCKAGCSCTGICSWANLKITWSLEVCSDEICRKFEIPHYDFMQPTTSWLNCCCSQSLPICL